MSLRQKLPRTSKAGTIAAQSGLRPRPQFEQIVDYLANGQEHVNFPDREAKFVRNHPFMTQLDFFDTNEEQKRAWEEQKRQEEAKQTAQTLGLSQKGVLALEDGPKPSKKPGGTEESSSSSSSSGGGGGGGGGGGASSSVFLVCLVAVASATVPVVVLAQLLVLRIAHLAAVAVAADRHLQVVVVVLNAKRDSTLRWV